MLLKLVESLPLLLDHVTVGKREIVDAFNLFELLLVLNTLFPLVLQDLVCHDEGIGLVRLIFTLIM